MRVVCADTFRHDGRGPSLVYVHLRPGSAQIQAIDYELTISDDNSESRRHLLFYGAQVYMFTPEEVENYGNSAVDWGATGRGALVSLGRTSWVSSFNPRHLDRCEHFRAMFYDDFLDILCERIESAPGYFIPDAHSKPWWTSTDHG